MIRSVGLTTVLLFALAVAYTVRAQDVQGVELCSREARMDRRTGCLQSNVEYLQGLITKNAADTQQKLKAAAGEIGALKAEIAALKGQIAAINATLAAAQASLQKLQAAGAKREGPADKPAAK